MEPVGLLDRVPLWGVYLATSLICLLAVEIGLRLAMHRLARSLHDQEASLGTMVGAMLGLLAFILAFTFDLAASHFDAKKSFVVDEANAIGTTYLRAQMLAEPQRAEIRKLLRAYVSVRLQIVQPGQAARALRRTEELQNQLWSEAVSAGDKNLTPVVSLFIASLNEVIDLHAKRVNLGIRNRVPISIWAGLYFILIVTMGAVGYHAGMTRSRRSPMILALALTFSAVTLLIADLDRSHEGVLTESLQAMADLQDSFMRSTL